ncbi:UDP-N-acetylglucosamine transferase [compost metagenome]
MESLQAGVPMLIHPICNDQDHQAHFIEKSGVGKKIDLEEMDVTEVRAQIQNLLHDQDTLDRVKKVSRSYQVNGAKKAAELIVQAITA